MQGMAGHPLAALGVVLAVLLACAFVLDAFELIFLIVPIVMPPVLAQLDDAAWIATLTLLALQAGFLLPPFGWCRRCSRAGLRLSPVPPPAALSILKVLAPYLLALLAVMALVIAVPDTTRWLRTAPAMRWRLRTP